MVSPVPVSYNSVDYVAKTMKSNGFSLSENSKQQLRNDIRNQIIEAILAGEDDVLDVAQEYIHVLGEALMSLDLHEMQKQHEVQEASRYN